MLSGILMTILGKADEQSNMEQRWVVDMSLIWSLDDR